MEWGTGSGPGKGRIRGGGVHYILSCFLNTQHRVARTCPRGVVGTDQSSLIGQAYPENSNCLLALQQQLFWRHCCSRAPAAQISSDCLLHLKLSSRSGRHLWRPVASRGTCGSISGQGENKLWAGLLACWLGKGAGLGFGHVVLFKTSYRGRVAPV